MKRKVYRTLHTPLFWFYLSIVLAVVATTSFEFLSIKDKLFASFLILLLAGRFFRQRLPTLSHSNHPLSKVLVVQYDPFLSAGIEKSLRADEDIVMRTINQPNEMSLLEEIYQFRPYTIVLAGWSPTINDTDLKMILNELDQVRLIAVGMQDKHVHIFEKKRFKVNKAEDFAFLMRRGSQRMLIQEEGIYVKNKLFLWNDYIVDFPDETL